LSPINRRVSVQAQTCPGCGAHLGAIELTGKSWKVMMLLGGVGMCVGMFLIALSFGDGHEMFRFIGWPVLGVSFWCAVIGRIGAWWHHG